MTALNAPVSEKKEWSKKSVCTGIGLALLISASAVLAGAPLEIVFWVNVAVLIAFEIYGRVTGKVETPPVRSYEQIHAGFIGHDLNGFPDTRLRD